MMKFKRNRVEEGRLRKLAQNIESLVQTDFVDSVNRLLSKVTLDLGPPEYSAEAFRDPGANVIQLNAAGRLVHIEFQATDTPTSTEEFRIPYIMRGAVRCFNQQLLDQAVIPELHLFYCLEKNRHTWLLFDPRTHRTVPFDKECLTSLMERLV
jgi:hypothetical protein